jgi:multidrug efflux pump subunit AcrA (membrane-fusion protein)
VSRRALLLGLCISSIGVGACGGDTSAAAPGGGRGGRGRGGDAGPAPVVIAKAVEKDVPVDIAAIGNVEAYVAISIRSQVTGQLTDVSFREGDFVKFEAALAQAEANLTRDKAVLAQVEAQLNRDASTAEYQQLSAERQSSLSARGIIKPRLTARGHNWPRRTPRSRTHGSLSPTPSSARRSTAAAAR